MAKRLFVFFALILPTVSAGGCGDETCPPGVACDCGWGYHSDAGRCVPDRPPARVLIHGTLIDGTDAAPIADTAVVIYDGHIAAVGPSDSIIRYPTDEVIDLQNRFILPGFINAHVHSAVDPDRLRAWAQAGITTVREVGAALSPPTEWLQTGIDGWDSWAAAILGGTAISQFIPPAFARRDGDLLGPEFARLLSAGPCLTAVNGYPGGALSLHINTAIVNEGGSEITPVEDARRKAALMLEAGADLIKICLENYWGTQSLGLLSGDQIAAIVSEAHAAGVPVTAHVSADEQLSTCLSADPPVDDTSHIVTDSMSDANITAMVEKRIGMVPTLAVWEAMGSICDNYGHCEEGTNLGRFVAAGGRVALGDDYGNHGIVLGMPYRDMLLMQDAGMSNAQIIAAGTRVAAELSWLDDDLGTLEVGKRADILVVDADPLVSLGALLDVAYVFKDGQAIRTP